MKISRVVAAGLALAASVAAAQTYTVQPPLSQPYVPLVGATTVTTSSSDDGSAIVPLGFTFPYYGQNYTQVHVNTNGFLAFGTVNCGTCRSGDMIPSTVRTTHTLISPWWDDLIVTSPGVIRKLLGP
ncbi:MAG: Endonuclease/exonuclease/phosphatase family protein, partial [Myxococcaceae bacterium]|nr:Endonuclease/exonuclease/phosphatase family protein [Myxococcaceae bacterium]